MARKYLFKAKDARRFNKYGVDLTVYGENYPPANVVHVQVNQGHFQEFYDLKSAYIYYIVKGKGTFYLNDQKVNERHVRFVDKKESPYWKAKK
ncbi:hypothetical protein KKH13_02810 [Patescibacteria group bacterium]|nr:hypothetical protein [Patescibacteria group bacterium]